MTTRRTLTTNLSPDWRSALRRTGKAAQADSDQGETLNFESPGAFFGRLTERSWALVTALLGQGALVVRELARQAGRWSSVPAPDQQWSFGRSVERIKRTVCCPCAVVHADHDVTERGTCPARRGRQPQEAASLQCCQGLITAAPAALKGPTSRVATAKSLAMAMAAM